MSPVTAGRSIFPATAGVLAYSAEPGSRWRKPSTFSPVGRPHQLRSDRPSTLTSADHTQAE